MVNFYGGSLSKKWDDQYYDQSRADDADYVAYTLTKVGDTYTDDNSTELTLAYDTEDSLVWDFSGDTFLPTLVAQALLIRIHFWKSSCSMFIRKLANGNYVMVQIMFTPYRRHCYK